MRVVLTGANGFIGREITAELKKNGHTVIGIGRTAQAQNLIDSKNGLDDFFIADITDCEKLKELECLENIDAVIHSAGLAHQFKEIEKEKFYNVNVIGTINVSELAEKLKARQFILISSTAVYGIKDRVSTTGKKPKVVSIDEETACQPETLYAESKLEAEKVCIEICLKNRKPLTVLRLAPVIGEGNVGNAARLISAIDRKRFIWIGKGKNLKTLIYKADVARAVSTVLENKKSGIEIFNLAGKPIPMAEFVAAIQKGIKKDIPPFFIPPGILQIIFSINTKILGIKKIEKLSATVEKWLSDDIYSGKKIKRIYDFEPQTTPEDALAAQIRYYLAEKSRVDRSV